MSILQSKNIVKYKKPCGPSAFSPPWSLLTAAAEI